MSGQNSERLPGKIKGRIDSLLSAYRNLISMAGPEQQRPAAEPEPAPPAAEPEPAAPVRRKSYRRQAASREGSAQARVESSESGKFRAPEFIPIPGQAQPLSRIEEIRDLAKAKTALLAQAAEAGEALASERDAERARRIKENMERIARLEERMLLVAMANSEQAAKRKAEIEARIMENAARAAQLEAERARIRGENIEKANERLTELERNIREIHASNTELAAEQNVLDMAVNAASVPPGESQTGKTDAATLESAMRHKIEIEKRIAENMLRINRLSAEREKIISLRLEGAKQRLDEIDRELRELQSDTEALTFEREVVIKAIAARNATPAQVPLRDISEWERQRLTEKQRADADNIRKMEIIMEMRARARTRIAEMEAADRKRAEQIAAEREARLKAKLGGAHSI